VTCQIFEAMFGHDVQIPMLVSLNLGRRGCVRILRRFCDVTFSACDSTSKELHTRTRRRRRSALCGICLILCLGCRSEHSTSAGTAVSSAALPKLVLRRDTRDLMLTWVDATGDFHVVSSVDEVPTEARERVRVVVTTQTEGTGDPIYVADLRQEAADGSYPTSIVARAVWEETGAARRKARIESLAPVASLIPPQPEGQAAAQESSVVVVYGAEWCGACREAERYLKSKGIKVLQKDVDQSPAVQAELRAKLSKAGIPATSSIPIIDIGGRLIVGFSKPAVDAALKAVKP
jgi:glutaredoxin